MPLGSDPTDDEVMRALLADFPAWCSMVDIRLKAGGSIPFDFDSWYQEQKRFELQRTGRDLILKPRQVGFSTLELARDLWFAVVHDGVNVLVVAHDADLAEQLFLVLKQMAEGLAAQGLLPKTKYSNKRELVFADTGSAVRVVEAGATDVSAAKKGRSGTIHRLHATEVAFWGAASETMAAIMGSVPDSAEVVIESTANGAGGLFYRDVQAARADTSGYKLHFFAWYDHEEYRRTPPPDFDPEPVDEWEERLRAAGCDDAQICWWRSKINDPKIGLEKALQEFPVDQETCFRASGRPWFEPTVMDKLAPMVIEPIREASLQFTRDSGGQLSLGRAQIFEEAIPGQTYVVFGDVAEGVAADGSAATVLDKAGRTVAVFWSDAIEPGDFGLVLAVLGLLYNTALVSAERNNHGHATLRALDAEAHYPNIHEAEDGKPGWNTTSASRPILWNELAEAIRDGSAWTPDAQTLAECRTIIRDKDGKPRAQGKKTGGADSCRDDRFVAWAGAWQLRSAPVWDGAPIHIKGL